MKRNAGLVALFSALFGLSACGGIQSPGFEASLKGIDITFTPVAGSTVAATAPGGSFQFVAVGLFSTPPGTQPSAQTVSCATSAEPAAVCTTGAVTGVTWSVDPSANPNGAIASVNGAGLATGLRRGVAIVRAKLETFEATESLEVNGGVLTSFTITATPGVSVPTGRSITLTANPRCTDEDGRNVACLRTDYNYNWTLPSNFPAETVTFSPSPAVGRTIVVKTNRFGPFSIDASAANEEGTAVLQSINLDATERVLDDIIVSADPAQTAPVPVIVGTKTRFIARGRFSDGAIDDIRLADLRSRLVWTQDSSAVGRVIIENDAATASPNAAVLVSGDQVGLTGLTATGRNIETTGVNGPNGLELVDRIGVEVKTFGLLGLADICPFDSIGSECRQGLQLPLNTTTKFKARGFFADSPNTPRDIDATKIPLTWSKTVTPTSGDVEVLSAGSPAVTTGEYRAIKGGSVTLSASLTSPTFEPNATPRTVSTGAVVIEPICREQFFASNGTTSTVSSTDVTNAGNVIDADPNTFGTITLTSGVLLGNGDQSMSFQRAATTVTPTTTPAQTAGFIIAYDRDVFSPDSLATIQTLNADGGVVQNLTVSSSELTSIPQRNGQTLVAAKVTPTMPFTGMRLTVEAPAADGSGGLPIPVVGELLALLLGGGETDVDVYAACSSFSN